MGDKGNSKSIETYSKIGQKETGKTKVVENNHNTKKKNNRTKKSDIEHFQAQTSKDQKKIDDEFSRNTDDDAKKRKRKQNGIEPVDSMGEKNKRVKNKISKSTEKENENDKD